MAAIKINLSLPPFYLVYIMDGWILVIDCNTENYEQEKEALLKSRVALRFAASMEQARSLLYDEDYWLIVIVADNLDYVTNLYEFVNIATARVLIISTMYVHTEKLASHRAGAIAYLGDVTFITAVPCIWFLICHLTQPRTREIETLRISTYRNILLCEQCSAVFIGENKVILTYKEFALLEYLMNNAGRVMSHNQIYEYVWEREIYGDTRVAVKKLVNRLRQNISDMCNADKFIQTIWDKGYKIDTH